MVSGASFKFYCYYKVVSGGLFKVVLSTTEYSVAACLFKVIQPTAEWSVAPCLFKDVLSTAE